MLEDLEVFIVIAWTSCTHIPYLWFLLIWLESFITSDHVTPIAFICFCACFQRARSYATATDAFWSSFGVCSASFQNGKVVTSHAKGARAFVPSVDLASEEDKSSADWNPDLEVSDGPEAREKYLQHLQGTTEAVGPFLSLIQELFSTTPDSSPESGQKTRCNLGHVGRNSPLGWAFQAIIDYMADLF